MILVLDDTATPDIDAIVVDNVDGGIGYSTTIDSVAVTANVADGNALGGLITFDAPVGGWIVNISTGVSSPIIGPSATDLNSVNVSGPGAGTLILMLTDTDFLLPLAGFKQDIGGTTQGELTAQAFLDPGNVEFGKTFMTDLLEFGPGPFSGTGRGAIDPATTGAYSLTQIVTIKHSGPGKITSFDAYDAVPEPSALALMGLGLFGIGYSKLRKRS